MTNAFGVERARREGTLLGVPLGELGFFQTLLMSAATGFAAFFAATFVAIVAMLGYLIGTGKTPDFARTYKIYGAPVGVLVLLVTFSYLMTLWARRKLRRA